MPSRMLAYGGALLLWLVIASAMGGESLMACAKILESLQVRMDGLLEGAVADLSGTGTFEVNVSSIKEAIMGV